MLDRFLQWLSALSEAEKSVARKPVGLSRRSFLGALGITAVSVSLPGAAWRAIAVPADDDDGLCDLIELTLRDLGDYKWTEVCGDLQDFSAMRKLLTKPHLMKVNWQPSYNLLDEREVPELPVSTVLLSGV